MIVGLGIDLVGRSRVARMLESWDDRLLHRLMDQDEIASLPRQGERAQALAEAIAVKEAASKALGTGWSHGIRWRDVVVRRGSPPAGSREATGELSLELRGEAASRAARLGSDGRTRLRVQTAGDLVLAEVWLLAR